MPDGLTPRQEKQLNLAIRHLGRAMKALDRAQLPLAKTGEHWLFKINAGERKVGEASDRLIAGMEELYEPEGHA